MNEDAKGATVACQTTEKELQWELNMLSTVFETQPGVLRQ